MQEDNKKIFSQFSNENQSPLSPQTSIVNKRLVSLGRNWVFWENYENNTPKIKSDWENNIKKIFEFNDIISFWQFLNKYHGSNLSNIFFNGKSIK